MDFNDDQLEQLILDGIIEFYGLDKNGEMLYGFPADLEERHPEIYGLIMSTHMQDIYELWELGFISMDVTSVAPTVRVAVKALDEEAVASLSPELRFTLEQILDLARQKEEE